METIIYGDNFDLDEHCYFDELEKLRSANQIAQKLLLEQARVKNPKNLFVNNVVLNHGKLFFVIDIINFDALVS